MNETHIQEALPMEARIMVFTVSFLLLFFIYRMVKYRRIWERYAILWVSLGLSVLAFAILVDQFDKILLSLNIEHPPSVYLLFAVAGVIMIILQCTVEITTLVRQNRDAVQEIAILEQRIHEIEKQVFQERTKQIEPAQQ